VEVPSFDESDEGVEWLSEWWFPTHRLVRRFLSMVIWLMSERADEVGPVTEEFRFEILAILW
jgi:hypothetical protein